MRNSRLVVALVALATIAAACGPFHMGSRERATLIFTNETQDQADVYAMLSSTSVRIGTVFASRTDTLQVPTSITDYGGQTQIIARLLGRNLQPSTGPLTLRATDRIRVRLSADGRNLFVTPD